MTGNQRTLFWRIAGALCLAWVIGFAAYDLSISDWWKISSTLKETRALFSNPPTALAQNWIELSKAIGIALVWAFGLFGCGGYPAKWLVGKDARLVDRYLAATLLGALILGIEMFILGLEGYWRPWIVWAIFGMSAGGGLYEIWKDRKRLLAGTRKFFAGLQTIERAILVPVAATVLLTLLYALSPPVQSDELRYHLAAPAEWIKAGRITYLPGSAFSNFPFIIDMHFGAAMLMGSDIAAKLAHFVFLLISAFTLARMVSSRAAGLFPVLTAVALLVTNPVAAPLAGWAFVDLGVLTFLLGMIYYLMRYAETPTRRFLTLSALMGGGAFAAKYTSVLPVAFAGALAAAFAWQHARTSRALSALKTLLAFGAISFACGAPWLAHNYYNTGNPFYPLVWSVFGGDDWSEEHAKFYADKAAEKGSRGAIAMAKGLRPKYGRQEPLGSKPRRWMALPWNTYRWPQAFESSPLGPLTILAIPFLCFLAVSFFRKRPSLRAEAVPGLFLLFMCLTWAATYQSNRFLLPVIALAIVILASCAQRGQRPYFRLAAMAAISYCLVAQIGWTATYFLAGDRYGALLYPLGKISRDAYLRPRVNYYDAAEWMNKNLGLDSKTLLAGEHRTFYFEPPVVASDWFDTPAFLRLLRMGDPEKSAVEILRERGFTHVLFNMQELTGMGSTFGFRDSKAGLIEQGPYADDAVRGITPIGPLGKGNLNYDYYRRRFTDEEWGKWTELALSSQLTTVYQMNPNSTIWVAKINPPLNPPATNPDSSTDTNTPTSP